MVVGADVENGVVLTVVPANQLIVLLGEREEVVAASVAQLTAFLHLSQQPGTADDGMSLEQFERRRGRHLTADDTCQVALNRHFVDGCDAVAIDH